MDAIQLCAIGRQDKETFRTLLNLYHHDLAQLRPSLFPAVDDSGFYDYTAVEEFFRDDIFDDLSLYWVRHHGHLAGFIVLSKPPYVKEGCDYCIQEFFIVGSYRKTGVGGSACKKVFLQHPGRYCLRIIQENALALSFWKKQIERVGKDIVCESDDDITYLFTV